MAATIYLLRHGQTTWNRAGIMQGHNDSPLTLRGIGQAEMMGKRLTGLLDGLDGTNIFASPLGRARQTAAIVADVIGHDYFDIRFDQRLREITRGDWDGLTVAQMRQDWPDTWAAVRADRWNALPPGKGENYAMVAARIDDFRAERTEDGVCVVVAHGAVVRIWQGLHLDLSMEAVARLEEPQDGFYRITPGHWDFIAADE